MAIDMPAVSVASQPASDLAANCSQNCGLIDCQTVDSGVWPRFRYVKAMTDLRPGSVVCRASAFVVTVSEEWTRRVCAACFAVADARLATCCSDCAQCFYCDGTCRDRHRASHSAVCPALQHFGQLKKVGKETMAVLRMLLEVLALEHGSNRGTAIGNEGGPTYDALQHHPLAFDTPKETTDWTKCCASFRTLVAACPWCPWRCGEGGEGSPTPPPPPTDAELHSLVSRIDSNCFGVFRPGSGDAAPRLAMGRNVDLLGRGLYLHAAMFNHSCSPNCSVSAGASTLEVVVDEMVHAGQELCISYIDLQQPVSARQKALSRHYHFVCECERCTEERSPAAGKAATSRLSYHNASHGGPKKQPPTKREKRDRREQRAMTTSTTASSGSGGGGDRSPHACERFEVVVHLELRVLLKLTKGSTPPARKLKSGKALLGTQLQVPVCSARLQCRRHAVAEDAKPRDLLDEDK